MRMCLYWSLIEVKTPEQKLQRLMPNPLSTGILLKKRLSSSASSVSAASECLSLGLMTSKRNLISIDEVMKSFIQFWVVTCGIAESFPNSTLRITLRKTLKFHESMLSVLNYQRVFDDRGVKENQNPNYFVRFLILPKNKAKERHWELFLSLKNLHEMYWLFSSHVTFSPGSSSLCTHLPQ